ncbi:MAG: HAMP domain-containing histidine kinase [Corynebacteriales bacterium]|nr:HAMP domain-containing histidine kinase [Mycobacteriales bacterium]
MKVRFPLRWRLTLLYGAAFFAAGVVLLAVNYAFVRHSIEQQGITFVVPKGMEIPNDAAEKITDEATKYQQELQKKTLHELLKQSIFALILMGIAALLLGYVVADRALAPLGRITASARRVAGGKLSERIGLAGPDDEVKELAETFDDMVARLEAAFAAQQRFVAHASHELRTPLAMERTVLEVALADPDVSADLRDTGEKLLEVNRRNEELITGLLLLARSERELAETEAVDLVAVAEHAIDQVEPEFESAQVELRAGNIEPLTVLGSPVLLDRMITNLLQNAARHNLPETGWAELSVRQYHHFALIEVSNTGTQIPQSEVQRLFEPFQSLSGERTRVAGVATSGARIRGTGLGLSIVRAIVRTHRGAVRAVPRPDGGLSVQVKLPLIPQSEMAS